MIINKEILMLGNIKIEKKNFFNAYNVDTEKLLVSNKVSFGEKNYEYFIGYLYHDNEAKSLRSLLSQTSANVESYDGLNGCTF